MRYQNIEFHNVEELQQSEKGMILWRVPGEVREKLNTGAAELSARYAAGVELRFCLKGERAEIILRAEALEEAQMACIYYGSFQGGWQHSTAMIGPEETRIAIPRPEHMDHLKRITREKDLPFDPEVVRLVLPYGLCCFVGAEGDLEPPRPEQLPSRTYLAYGSSITHGSLALAMPYTYPFRISQKLKCDYLNLGFAGSAHLERAMAEYLVSRRDWDFASVELGVNMLGEEFTAELFEKRADDFTAVLGADPRKVFATDIFGFFAGNLGKAKKYRDIVHKYAGNRLIYMEAERLLKNPAYVSQDGLHPSLEGMEQIAERWYEAMRRQGI